METLGGQAIPLASGDGWRATELRYQSPDEQPLAMTIVVPDNLAAFEKGLNGDRLASVTKAVAPSDRIGSGTSTSRRSEAAGSTPTRRICSSRSSGTETRAGLERHARWRWGCQLAFEADAADFSGMTTEDALHIGIVIHQANIDVDERGTEAAAATAVGMDTGGCTGPQPRDREDAPRQQAVRVTSSATCRPARSCSWARGRSDQR